IPHQTLFLWGGHSSWVAHSWLSQLFYYEIMHIGGPALVLFFTALVNCVMVSLIWWLWNRNHNLSFLTPAIFAFGIWCAQARFNPRPELVSAFFEVLLLVILVLTEQKYFRRRYLLWLIPLFILWTNLHGGVAMGIALLLVTLIAETAQRLYQKESLRPALAIGAVFIGCVAAMIINPFGWHYYVALTQVGGAMFALIDEWKSPFIAPLLVPEAIAALFILTALALFSWLGNVERKWSHLGWLLLALLMFIDARRNLELLALVSLIVIAANPQLLKNAFSGTLKRWIPAIATAYVFIMLIAATPPSFNPLAPKLPRGVADTVLREQQTQPHLRIFNDYLNSSYFQWRFAGHPPLYIDLLNGYPADLLQKYFSIIHADAKGLQQFQKLHVDLVAFGPYTKTSRQYPLAQYLDNSKEWKRIYSGDDGSVWKRQGT
ncbi:MAG: hypothetical protein ABI210_09015, partial [Abditibacteriaceae bacterium]